MFFDFIADRHGGTESMLLVVCVRGRFDDDESADDVGPKLLFTRPPAATCETPVAGSKRKGSPLLLDSTFTPPISPLLPLLLQLVASPQHVT